MSKRASAPAAPKPPTTLAPSVTLPESASLAGTHRISIGERSVVQPRAMLVSTFAPLSIGRVCIIGERTQIGFLSQPEAGAAGGGPADATASAPSVGAVAGVGSVIEDYVVIEVGAVVEASRVGEGSLIEVKATIGKGAVLGKHCKISPLCSVAPGEILPDYTVVFGEGERRIDASGIRAEEAQAKMLHKQVETLSKLIPSNLAKYN